MVTLKVHVSIPPNYKEWEHILTTTLLEIGSSSTLYKELSGLPV